MPGADPELALRLAKATVDIYAQAVADLLAMVARRIASGIDTPGWAERKLLEVAALRDEAVAVLDRAEALAPDAISEAVTTAYRQGIIDAAREMGVTTSFGATSTHAVDRFVAETIEAVTSTQTAILRTVLDVYRTTISETASSVLTGTMTRRQAAQRALDRFADRGVTGFRDSLGRHWTLESYTETATRTAVGRAQVQGALDRIQGEGNDLVIVSDAPQECSVCRPWEGVVLSVAGFTPGVPTVDDARSAGLFHANCRHQIGAYIPGLTRRMTHTADPEGDAARQEQRRLERGVRQWKRRSSVALDDDTRRAADRRVRQWQSRLKEHVDEHDLKRLRAREQIGSAL